mmetsp:Transcript_123686/g.309116  ORF Transcript_123686/g.309116 Transcript_123686/m.309116 type:complete len:345 (-) Transcript_123686:647-1681(-)
MLHPRNNVGRGSCHDRKDEEENARATGSEAALLRLDVPEGHEREHLEACHEGAKLEPTKPHDHHKPGDATRQCTRLRHKFPETHEDRHRDTQCEKVSDQEQVDDAGADLRVLCALDRHGDGRNVHRDQEGLSCKEGLHRTQLFLQDVAGKHGYQASLERVHGGGHHADSKREDQGRDARGLTRKQVEEGQEVKEHCGRWPAQVLCLGEHACKTKKHHCWKDEPCAKSATFAQRHLVACGIDPLPIAHVEKLRAENCKRKRHQGLEALVTPRGNHLPLAALDLNAFEASYHANHDEYHHDDALKPVGPNGSRQSCKRGVQHGEQRHGQEGLQWVKARHGEDEVAD